MKQNKEQKWYPNKVGRQWYIQSGPEQTAPDVLADIWVGEEQAERNAILAASAPEMKALLDDMYLILANSWGQGHPEIDKWVKKYKEIIK